MTAIEESLQQSQSDEKVLTETGADSGTEIQDRVDDPVNVFEGLSRVQHSKRTRFYVNCNILFSASYYDEILNARLKVFVEVHRQLYLV